MSATDYIPTRDREAVAVNLTFSQDQLDSEDPAVLEALSFTLQTMRAAAIAHGYEIPADEPVRFTLTADVLRCATDPASALSGVAE